MILIELFNCWGFLGDVVCKLVDVGGFGDFVEGVIFFVNFLCCILKGFLILLLEGFFFGILWLLLEGVLEIFWSVVYLEIILFLDGEFFICLYW